MRWNSEWAVISQFNASPSITVHSMARAFGTGRAPGRPRQVGQMLVLGSEPKSTAHPQNILELVESST